MTTIAFIGLGNMGLPMASNLAKQFKNLVCHDISPAARQHAAAAGLTLADNATATATNASVVISMLPAGEHVHALLNGDSGLFAAANANTLFIDCSTTSPQEAHDLAAAATATEKGLAFIDAPVSGGIGGARTAMLSFLVGATAETFARATPLLSAMGANVFHAGGIGDGQAAKLCNNMMLSVQMIGACETLALGQKLGLNSKTLSDIIRKSSGSNWVFEKYNPMPGVMDNVPAANNYNGGFMTKLMLKDSDLALAAANANNAATPMAALANQLFRLHRDQHGDELDFGSILKMFNR